MVLFIGIKMNNLLFSSFFIIVVEYVIFDEFQVIVKFLHLDLKSSVK